MTWDNDSIFSLSFFQQMLTDLLVFLLYRHNPFSEITAMKKACNYVVQPFMSGYRAYFIWSRQPLIRAISNIMTKDAGIPVQLV